MKVTRGFAYIGGVRKFRMHLDKEEVATVKLSSSITVDIVPQHQTVQFRTMKLEKSKIYYLTQEVSSLHVNVNPMFRMMYGSLLVIFGMLFLIRPFVSSELSLIFSMLLVLSSIIVLVIHFTNLDSYIKVLAYDENNNLIPLEQQKDE